MRRRKFIVFLWRRTINTDDINVARTGGDGKINSFDSLMGYSHISSSYCSQKAGPKNDSYSPALLPFAWDLMEKPEGVKSAMMCLSHASVIQGLVQNKISKFSSSISACSSQTLFLHDGILSSPIFRSMGLSTQQMCFATTPLLL